MGPSALDDMTTSLAFWVVGVMFDAPVEPQLLGALSVPPSSSPQWALAFFAHSLLGKTNPWMTDPLIIFWGVEPMWFSRVWFQLSIYHPQLYSIVSQQPNAMSIHKFGCFFGSFAVPPALVVLQSTDPLLPVLSNGAKPVSTPGFPIISHHASLIYSTKLFPPSTKKSILANSIESTNKIVRQKIFLSWWLRPIWKIWVKVDHFPK